MIALETFRRVMRLHPWHFWGMASAAVPVTSSCGDVLAEDAWQMHDRLGRKDIAMALAEAENLIRTFAGFWPSKHWVTERVQFSDSAHDAGSPFLDPSGRFRPVVLNEKHIIACGLRQQTAIGTATVILTDTNGDGLPDTFTATTAATTTVTDMDEISVTGPDAVAGSTFDDARITPVAISLDGSNHVVVSGPAWLLADRSQQENIPDYAGLDPLEVGDAALFTTIKVWRDYTKTDGTTTDNSQSVLRVENVPGSWAGTDPAGVITKPGRAGIRSKRNGVVTPAEAIYDAVSGAWTFTPTLAYTYTPTSVDVRVCAGLTNGQGDEAVCRLAAAILTSRVCACDTAEQEVARWQTDLAETGGNEGFAVSPEDLGNPFGTRRGHVAAWKWVMSNRVASAMLA